MVELKPCPFCGSTDIKIDNSVNADGYGVFWIEHVCETDPLIDISTASVYTEKDAIQAWNTRQEGNDEV